MGEWERIIKKGIAELMIHPFGGKLELFVWPDAKASRKVRLKTVVYLNTMKRQEIEVTLTD